MHNLFIYGTLMFDDVWQRLIKKQYQTQSATLKGFRRFSIKNQTYPGIVKSRHHKVEGLLVMNLSSRDLRKLDYFEGRYYKRTRVSVNTSSTGKKRAYTYIMKNRFRKLLENKDWDVDDFVKNRMNEFISSYRHFH